MTDTLNQTTHLRYDARGNVIQSWDALGNTTDIAYNLADQPTDIWAPATGQTGSGRTRTQATYLYAGGPSTTSRLYDESGGLFRTVVSYYGPEGETLGSSGDTTASAVTYDALYRTKTLRDASNNVTSYSYDSLGNVSQIVYPGADGSGKDTVNFTAYDADGQLRQRIDGRGHVTNYTYNDAEGQLTNVTYPYSSGENISYSYDAYGLPQSVADATGTRTYTLNASDVLAQVSTVFKKLDGTLTSAKNISYTYNADGSRAGMTTPAGTFAYGYDNGGRWTGLRDHQNNVSSWNYDPLNRMSHQQLSSGAQTNYTYNALSQLVGLANLSSNGGDLSKFGHESDPAKMLLHDAAGNLTREVASYDPWSSSRFFIGTTNYSYDNKDQLLNETSTRYSPRNDTFGYDAMGNPTSWKGSTRSFNANNQETTGGTSQFSYDGNGNAVKYKGNTLTFDEENHMTSFTTPSGTTPLRATYRSDGLRGWKQVSSGNRYFFLYDGDQIVCGFNGNGDLSRINVWGASGLIGRQSGTNGGTPVYDYAWDDRGNISQVLNTNSSVASNYLVSAWGEASTDNAAYDPYRCMGGQFGNYFDAETGLILCGQRYYDPSGGRWLTRDPISYAGGLNVYGYVENNPVNASDPYGLSQDMGGSSGTVRFSLATFIPQSNVTAPGGLGFAGDGRGFSYNSRKFRTQLNGIINLRTHQISLNVQNNTGQVGTTHGTSGASKGYVGTGDYVIPNYSAEKTSCGYTVHIFGFAGNPYFGGAAPPISHVINVYFDNNGNILSGEGTSGRFPALELWTYRGNSHHFVYGYDPRRAGATPGDLARSRTFKF